MASTSRPNVLILILGLVLVLAPVACSDDGGGDGDGSDAGGDAGDAGDDGGVQLPPVGESLQIAFATESRGLNPGDPVEWKLFVTDEDCQEWPENTCDATEVQGGNFSCEAQGQCRISLDMDYALWIDPADTGSLRIATLNADLTVADDDRVLAQGVGTWQMGPDLVVFSRAGSVWAAPYDGSPEYEIASITSQDGRRLEGGFHYAPHIDRVIVSIPTSLSAMDLIEVGVSDPTQSRLLYHFVSDVEGRAGSFYLGQHLTTVSPDGNLVAIFTDALDTTNPCDPNASTSTCDPEYTCSSNSNRCIGEQLLLHIINRPESDLLSVPGNLNACAGDAECGQYHACDLSNPDASNMGVCAPGKRIIGPWRNPCSTDNAGGPRVDPGEYTMVHSPMWRADGHLMFIGGITKECPSTNIDPTDLVAIDPGLATLDRVIDHPEADHGGSDCSDDVEQDYTPEGCNVSISSAEMSPSGQTVIFVANSVRSPTDTEVWLIDAWGRGGKDDLTRDTFTTVLRVEVFAP